MTILLCVLGAVVYLAIGVGVAWLLTDEANWALAIILLWLPAAPFALVSGCSIIVAAAIGTGIEFLWKRFSDWWTYGRPRKTWRPAKARKGG